MQTPEWNDETERLVLALAVRGDMLSRSPSAVVPQTFGSVGSSSSLSPRQRLASVIQDFWVRYSTPPTPIYLEQAVASERKKLSPEEGAALDRELGNVLAVPIKDDAAWVYDFARKWAEYRRLADAINAAAVTLKVGVEGVASARSTLAGGFEVDDQADGRLTFFGYEQEAKRRVGLWGAEDYGERIETGLPELDRVLQGGPTRREVFYFLAPPKGAKTASLLRVALGAARRRHGVYVVTYEMQAIRMALRLDRMLARKSKQELRDDATHLTNAIEGLRETGAEIYIEERPPQTKNSVGEVERRVERIRKGGGTVDVVVLDYLNIMGSSRNETEKRHELARISRDIGRFARDAGVLVWSAALVNRQAVNKETIRKTDIAEAFEVVAVADGMVAICAPPDLVEIGVRGYWVAAAREEADEVSAGYYRVDFARMVLDPIGEHEVKILRASAAAEKAKRNGGNPS